MTPPPSPPSNSRQDVPRPPPPAPPQHPSSGPRGRGVRPPPPRHPSHGPRGGGCNMHVNHAEFLPMFELIFSHRIPPYQRAVDQLHQLIADIPSTADCAMIVKADLFLDFRPYVHLADVVKETVPREIEAARSTDPALAASMTEGWERLQPLLEDVNEVFIDLLAGFAQAAMDQRRTGQRGATISGEGGLRLKAILTELAESDAYGPIPGLDLSRFLPPPRQSWWKSLFSMFR